MNPTSHSIPMKDQVLDEAAEWLIECRAASPDAERRKAFDAWLRASPDHLRAYLGLLPLWESSAELNRAAHPDVASLIESARCVAPNVVPFDAHGLRAAASSAHAESEGMKSRAKGLMSPAMRFITGAIAASTLIGAVCGAWLYFHRNTYATDVGEQRLITLADGSAIELNARSKINVHFTAAHREVDLVEGQALFRVAHNPERPFTVVSGDTRIRAVGTEFDVYRKLSGSTTISVIEGRVSVASADNDPDGIDRPSTPQAPVSEDRASGDLPPARELLLSAGEQISIGIHQRPLQVASDPTRVIAWTQGRLVFSATPLSEVAEEFNRYNTRRLVIESPEIATLRVNGVFSSTDLGTLLAFLREQPGIAVTESETEIRISRR